MKSVFRFAIAVLFCALITNVASARNYTIDNHWVNLMKVDSSSPDILQIHVKNISDSDVNVKYTILTNSFPFSGWEYQICDLNTCFASASSMPNSNTNGLDSKQLSAFSVDVLHYRNYKVVAEFKVVMWDEKHPDETDTLRFTINANRLGVENKSIPGSFISLYPNPATNYIYLQNTADFQPSKAIVVNAMGQVVVSQGITSQTTRLPIDALEKGLYFVRLQDKNGREAIKQFVRE
jgi:hypothetical protein